jgi:hypothetical protein
MSRGCRSLLIVTSLYETTLDDAAVIKLSEDVLAAGEALLATADAVVARSDVKAVKPAWRRQK